MTDLIIRSASFRTMHPDEDTASGAEAGPGPHTAVAVADGLITHVGGDVEILALAGPETRIVDARGATLTPGLIDSHMHPVWGAELTEGIDLGGLTTLSQVQEAVRSAAAELPADAWIRGWNLDYAVFDDEIRGDLFDEAAEGRPVALVLMDLHTGVGNRAALEAAGIDGTEEFTDGSLVVVDDAGRPTGELREIPAYLLLLDAAPRHGPDPHRRPGAAGAARGRGLGCDLRGGDGRP